uniref:DUF2905 domain-containing protein n=1 Tax=candidate division WOR-3 bacterium TaxID=2052148 RepID=A0A7C3URZ5_UNCW3
MINNFIPSLGKILITIGLFFIFFGILLFLLPRTGLFRLPGDFLLKRKNFVFYFPLATSIIISLFLTIILNLILRMRSGR